MGKALKPVIAVLAVQTPNGEVKLYRGTNMEVSMPTGSLCAERNVIGTALADNPSLKRQDLKVIAVLAVPNYKQSQSLPGSGGIPQPQSMNSIASLATATLEDESSGKSPFIQSRKSSIGEEDDWIFQDHAQQMIPILDKIPGIVPNYSENLPLNLPLDSSLTSHPLTPARRIPLYNKPHHKTRKQKRTVVVHSDAVRRMEGNHRA